MNKQTWNEIATTPFGEHPSDKFINATAIYHDSLENTGSFSSDMYDLGDMRFLTSSGNVRQLIGTSAKVAKKIVRKGKKLNYEVREMFLSPSREMFLPTSVVFPKKGWLPYSTSKSKVSGIPSGIAAGGGWSVPMFDVKTSSRKKRSMCGMEGMCSEVCISMTGNLVLNSSLRSRYCKSWFWRSMPIAFLRLLIYEIKKITRLTKADSVYFRLNGTSDVWWESYLHMDDMVDGISKLGGFNDYTKYNFIDRVDEYFPKNYRITFSVDEKRPSLAWAKQWLLHGHGVSIVCESEKKKKPPLVLDLITAHEHVIDGDLDDARFADPPGAIVLLRNKGPLKVDKHCGTRKNGRQKHLIMPTLNIKQLVEATS